MKDVRLVTMSYESDNTCMKNDENFDDENLSSININLRFTVGEFKQIKKGFGRSNAMNDEWHIFLQDDWLYLNRCGIDWCAYKLRFAFKKDYLRVVRAFTGYNLSLVGANDYHVIEILAVLYLNIFNDPSFVNVGSIIRDNLRIDVNSIHGINHWLNVRRNGKYLSSINGADQTVIDYFGLLHDSQRENDGSDLEHGKRAGKFVRRIIDDGMLSNLSTRQQEQLYYACLYHHVSNAVSDDVTVQTCWDADRLDLWRVMTIPDREMLYTSAAKTEEAFEYSKNLQEKY